MLSAALSSMVFQDPTFVLALILLLLGCFGIEPFGYGFSSALHRMDLFGKKYLGSPI